MKQNFTPNHLLLAAYGEYPASSAAQMHYQMECNESLALEMQSIIDSQELLDNFIFSPSATSIKIILKHSRENLLERSIL